MRRTCPVCGSVIEITGKTIRVVAESVQISRTPVRAVTCQECKKFIRNEV